MIPCTKYQRNRGRTFKTLKQDLLNVNNFFAQTEVSKCSKPRRFPQNKLPYPPQTTNTGFQIQQPEQTGITILGQNEESASILDFILKPVQLQ